MMSLDGNRKNRGGLKLRYLSQEESREKDSEKGLHCFDGVSE